MSFQLSRSLEGHSSDVRALSVSPEGVLFSGSRDKSVLCWGPGIHDGPRRVSSLSSYVSSIALSPKSGEIIVGSNDGLIRVYSAEEQGGQGEQGEKRVLMGHNLTVSCLHVLQSGEILSGSWDNTVRLWEEWESSSKKVLEGHSAAVWAVASFPDSGWILSGSADKTIRLWQSGICLKTLHGHTDCVRALVVSGPMEFLSGSNDASIRKWNLKGECLQVLKGHEHYIYNLSLGKEGGPFDLASVGEDRSIRLWNGGVVKQTLFVPAQSVWCVETLPNGDIAAGCSDGHIWIFSADATRQASPQEIEAFQESLSETKLANKTHLGDMKLSDIPGKESLLQPGKAEGATKMVREGKSVAVYSWSSGSWTKIGDVVGAPETNKEIFEGKEYDYVFSIDLDDPPRVIKLPYNTNQDPWTVAQNFIDKNLLPQVYLQEIVDFITKNARGATFGGESSTTTSRCVDPFTGDGAYSTCESNGLEGAPFPQTEFLQFGSPPVMTPMLKKLKEFNNSPEIENNPNLHLSEEELWKLPDFISQDSATQEDINVVIKILKWPLESLFPGLDILRLAVLKDSAQENLLAPSVVGSVLSVCLTNIEPASPNNNKMLALRTLCNLFWSKSGLKELKSNWESILNRLAVYPLFGTKNIEIALSTNVLNFSVALKDESSAQAQLVTSIVLYFLEKLTEPEALYRCLVSLGSLFTYSQDNVVTAVSLDASKILASLSQKNISEKVTKCANIILKAQLKA